MWDLSTYATNTAIITESGKKYSYQDLEIYTDKIQATIGSRCLIFILCRNSIGCLAGYIACINNNIVPLLLTEHINRNLLDQLIITYMPDFIWIPEEMRVQFSYEKVFDTLDYVLLKTEYEHAFPIYEQLALLLTTSGSTGSPKLVRQSYSNIDSNMKSIAQYLELTDTERPITTLPMNYTYGLSVIHSHLLTGASIILTEKTLLQKDFWDQCRNYKATSFSGVPYTYEMLDRLDFYNMDLPYLHVLTQAGGKLSPELHKKIAAYAKKTNKRFYIMYGQTEATARMAYLPYQHALDKYGSMGIAIPGGKLSLIDASGTVIRDADTIGELVYEGANVTLGYAECGIDLSKDDERNGVLVTGDMAKRDADGYYYIVGRKKRFLKIFGNRVNLDETERLIKSKYPDFECACVGTDDLMNIFITDAKYLNDIKKYLTQITGLHHSVFHVKYIPSIPKNLAGKIQYNELENYT